MMRQKLHWGDSGFDNGMFPRSTSGGYPAVLSAAQETNFATEN
jgi:hypothetical protein